MTGFLAGLGGKVAERWLALLTLPGCLFIVTAWVAWGLGQGHAMDWSRLTDTVSRWYEGASAARPGALGLIAIGLILLAALAGLAARLIGYGVLFLWFARWPGSLGRRMGDVEQRVSDFYSVDLQMLWPRLWLVLAPHVREELRTAITKVESAAVVGAWGLGYLALGYRWWPSLVIGAVVLGTGWELARQRTAEMAALVESAVDTGLRPVARSVGISPLPTASPIDLGLQLAPVLHKRLPAAPPAPRRWQPPAGPPTRNRSGTGGGP
ncbi:hypothetical protein ABZ572_33400 [Streptomyces sp. NPDC018338]|uniref:hypothetical protein n=1 Tax=Streptomyces sp. NPDC018338 TaxID=3157192 RepID=UPI0033DBB010